MLVKPGIISNCVEFSSNFEVCNLGSGFCIHLSIQSQVCFQVTLRLNQNNISNKLVAAPDMWFKDHLAFRTN